jgi:predicted N-acetyltransferase YhbS
VGHDDQPGITWMNAEDRPDVSRCRKDSCSWTVPARRPGRTPIRRRSGDDAEARLRQCSLYDPGLDVAVEAADGQAAGYALFWFDPVTEVGLVEPMRVEDAYQRRGLARAMLTAGLDRLAKRGARRLKVG